MPIMEGQIFCYTVRKLNSTVAMWVVPHAFHSAIVLRTVRQKGSKILLLRPISLRLVRFSTP